MNMLMNNKEYVQTLADIRRKIRTAQHKAILTANGELVSLYWNIGTIINEHSAWGNKFVENLARDIKLDFPNATGYSVRNLKYMAKFARLFPDFEIVQAVLAQITWYHNMALMDKLKNTEIYLWYAQKTVENGWSRNILVHQIEYQLYERQAVSAKTTNYDKRLPNPQSELAEQTLKDPYIFDFINYREGMAEREIENELVKNITKLLLELGTGFAFVGNQYHIEVENEDFYIDLLFYNLKLRCFVVIELKNGDFKPEYAGKLNFYISAVDDLLKTAQDNPTIGILLCKNKKGMIAEYALRDIDKPIGVSEYSLFDTLPKAYENILPSAEDIERRIGLKKKTDF
jgi:predicted nuclease of restriction endonuclease-like (RecB) superfamily